jgi:hypothetical protein
MSLALAACESDAQRHDVADLAADAKARLHVEPPTSIRPAALHVDRTAPRAQALSTALDSVRDASARAAALKALNDFLSSDDDPEKVAEAARKEGWDDAKLEALLALVADQYPTAALRTLLAALVKPRSRAPGQARLRKLVASWKPKRKASKA